MYLFETGDTKSVNVGFAVTKEQREQLEQFASANKMTLSQYCRSVLLEQTPPLDALQFDFLVRAARKELTEVECGKVDHSIMLELKARGLVQEMIPNGTFIKFTVTLAGERFLIRLNNNEQ